MKARFSRKHRSLLRDLLVLAAFVVVVVAAAALLAARAWRDISEQYILNASRRTAAEFQSMAANVEASLGMVRDWGVAGVLDLSDPKKTQELLFPFFGKNTMLSGISIADTTGNGRFLLPDGSLSDPSENPDYDYAQRPWFKSALAEDGFHWTEIYRFFTLDRHGITASIAWPAKKGGEQTVAAFDILLDDFFSKVQEMAPTPASRAFIFLPEGHLYVPDSEFQSVDLVKDELAKRGLSVWSDDTLWVDDGAGSREDPPELKVVQMNFKGESWWCGFVPLEKSNRKVWMGVLVPEADIVGDIANRRRLLFGMSAVAVLAVAALYLFFLWKTRRRVSEIDAEQVRDLIQNGENRSVEFKSTMRMNLHTKKPGKEIELAWLKGVAGFLNTEGGILLIGVADDGEIVGLERDVFENEDKCRLHFKNLVATHIGAELSRHIRFSMVPMDGKTVGVVECSRASKPAYLRNGNKEHFYIRNGPSSDELPVSKLVGYIQENWA